MAGENNQHLSSISYYQSLFPKIREYYESEDNHGPMVSIHDLPDWINISDQEGILDAAQNSKALSLLDTYGDVEDGLEGNLVLQMILKIHDIFTFFFEKTKKEKILCLYRIAVFLSLFDCPACLFHSQDFSVCLSKFKNALNEIIQKEEDQFVLNFAICVLHGCDDELVSGVLNEIVQDTGMNLEQVVEEYIDYSLKGGDSEVITSALNLFSD